MHAGGVGMLECMKVIALHTLGSLVRATIGTIVTFILTSLLIWIEFLPEGVIPVFPVFVFLLVFIPEMWSRLVTKS